MEQDIILDAEIVSNFKLHIGFASLTVEIRVSNVDLAGEIQHSNVIILFGSIIMLKLELGVEFLLKNKIVVRHPNFNIQSRACLILEKLNYTFLFIGKQDYTLKGPNKK